MLPEDSPFIWPAIAAIIWGLVVGVLGAIQGIMMACGKLHMGCPICDARSFVQGGNRDGVYFDCPHCGELRIKAGRLFGMQVTRTGTEDDDLADYRPDNASPLLAPKRHPVPFAIIFLPVVASIVVASVIHEFSFFYLLIPGFWCHAVGGFILDGIFSGSMSDNHGTALRARMPIRFWGKIAIWSLAYIFATVFPIGYALQERGKATGQNKQGGESNAPTASDAP